MKLKFSIDYGTQWGESMHALVRYRSADGTERVQNVAMTTADGQLWTAETAAVESRQHPVRSIVYDYQVEDAEGHVVRKEWGLVPRVYHFDSSRNYCFMDQWRDAPLNSHLYSGAYEVTLLKGRDGALSASAEQMAEAGRVPLYRRTILFRVSAPQLLPGQSVGLIGSHPALGAWSEARYLKMTAMGRGDWLLSVNVDGMMMPFEYKYVVVDDDTRGLAAWEKGDNRVATGEVADAGVMVLYGGNLRLGERPWRAAGVVVPVFSLRSEHSFGVGDFGDLKRMVDWVAATGMKVIQLLPVNDTTTNGAWHDSYPYNITSCMALHPHYLDLEQLGGLRSRARMTDYRRRQRELNALWHCDYEAVHRVKGDFVKEVFAEHGYKVLETAGFKAWMERNKDWLTPYAEWLTENGDEEAKRLVLYVQYSLHVQLMAAAEYARSKGVVLKGDLPIGVNGRSVETWQHPELFHTDRQTGAPPDGFSPNGQNWGFPTYDWTDGQERSDGQRPTRLTDWFRRRFEWMEQYFDAVRIDHVLGFFRIWEIPMDAVHGVLGHFAPAIAMTVSEIEYFGLSFRKELFTRPFINDRVVDRLFGIHGQYAREVFLVKGGYGLYTLKEEFATQRKVVGFFEGKNDENSLWIREALLKLIENVLFVEDPEQPDAYHPRINAWQEPVFDVLSGEEKEAYMRLYNNYFYQRHDFFWGRTALDRLTTILGQTRMLVCAEDLGMLPQCVAPVLDQLRILSLEVQWMPKVAGQEFGHLDGYPQRSVCTISTHDMPTLRQWWQENPERAQRYYVTMLQKQGRAPEQLPAHLAEEIIARHLYSPSMLCLLSWQDWLAMDGELRSKHVREERINVPSDPYNRWQWRMHLTIEQLMKAERLNNKIRLMISRSKR